MEKKLLVTALLLLVSSAFAAEPAKVKDAPNSWWLIDSNPATSAADNKDIYPDPTPTEPIQYINTEIPDVPLPEYPGKHYEALVPATLDLAERAALAINATTGMLNPNADLEMYWTVDLLEDPPRMTHNPSDHCRMKFFQTWPGLRAMSGSLQNLDLEHEVMKIFLKMQASDGLTYTPMIGRPWGRWGASADFGTDAEDAKADQLAILTWDNGRVLGAFTLNALAQPEGPWKEAAKRLAEALKKAIIVEGDEAYLFDFAVTPGWEVKPREEKPRKYPGASQANTAHGLVQYGNLMNDPEAIDLAAKIVRRILRDPEYYGPNGEFLPDQDNNVTNHFHSHLLAPLAALQIVELTGDRELLERSLTIFNWAASHASRSEPLTGFFPEFLNHETNDYFTKVYGGAYFQAETCEVSDMIHLAIHFSHQGIDKWDDADRWIRNQLAENQLMSVDWVDDTHLEEFREKLRPGKPEDREMYMWDLVYYTEDRVAERVLGGFAGWAKPNDWQTDTIPLSIMNCCTANGARALYFVWKNMIDFDEEADTLRVNLLFNRASEVADIDSHIPYTGRVDVKAKQKLNLEVRIPAWVKPDEVQCEVNGKSRALTFDGRYAKIGRVKKNQTATLTFPIAEYSKKVNIMGDDFTYILRGNTVVHVDPPGRLYPIYQRDHYRGGRTLYKKMTRFVPQNELNW